MMYAVRESVLAVVHSFSIIVIIGQSKDLLNYFACLCSIIASHSH